MMPINRSSQRMWDYFLPNAEEPQAAQETEKKAEIKKEDDKPKEQVFKKRVDTPFEPLFKVDQ